MGATITVLVPTFRRPIDLTRCLDALARQTRLPDDVIVVARPEDTASWNVIGDSERALAVRGIAVHSPGTIEALYAGLAQVTTEFVAITDDDAAPWPDWLARILEHFASDDRIGGVGGRDHLRVGGRLIEGSAVIVGKVPRIGKHVGNHHLGFGAARDVDVLKGVNGAFRTAALRSAGFDRRLRGTGAQVHQEIGYCQRMRRDGWRLLYDPAVAVDHYQALRFDEDQRDRFNPVATRNAVFNDTLIRLEYLSTVERGLQLLWSVVIGTRGEYGLAQWIRFFPRERGLANRKLAAALRGRADAMRELRRPAAAAAR